MLTMGKSPWHGCCTSRAGLVCYCHMV